MGIYLGQLPAPEIARLKAELAETLIAHFCYPRFFDNRTEALRMRPVDRAKRQEVWLFLSSVDFTLWNRVDLMSPDFQHQIERLFIQFVQRNRAFFGQQGRKRMSDVRMLIGTSASSVVQGLRNHLTGQRQGNPPFGSPRQAVVWSQPVVSGSPELSWEQISTATMVLQQQLQELRGEASAAAVVETRSANGASRRTARPQGAPAGGIGEQNGASSASSLQTPPAVPVGTTSATRSGSRRTLNPAPPSTPVAPQRKIEQPAAQVVAPVPAEMPLTAASANGISQATGPLPTPMMKSGAPASSPMRTSGPLPPASVRTSGPLPASVRTSGPLPDSEAMLSASVTSPSVPVPARGVAATADPRDASQLKVGEDDTAIFEQMRHQLIVWLRVEAVRAGLEVSTNLGPAQLLDMLRQQAHFDETRLQVVSTLLNLSNQIIRTGVVSVLDYKQALMFHLMHTRH